MTEIRDLVLAKELLANLAIKQELYNYIIDEEEHENIKNFAENYKSSKEFIFFKVSS